MEFFIFILVVSTIYGMLGFFDYFFRSCMMLPYITTMQKSGINIKFFSIKFHTTTFNRMLVKYSSKLPRIYKMSFKLGVYVTSLLFPVALVLVLISTFSSGSSGGSSDGISEKSSEIVRLEILLPGVNLPISQFGYYIVSMLICSVVHELGHGIAAVLEEIPVVGFGLNLIFVLPMAYTEIDTDALMHSTRVWKKLKVFCAGIWNNILLAGAAYILLLLSPILLTPFYHINSSVIITHIAPKSPLAQNTNGLYVNDIILEINDCSVTNEVSWIRCLEETINHPPAYCIKEEFVHANDETSKITHDEKNLINCCGSGNIRASCFENIVDQEDEMNLPQYVCLNIRKSIENSESYCNKEVACTNACLKPILANSSTIIHMKRKNNPKDLIYFGHPYDVASSIEISEFVPKTNFIKPWLGNVLTTMLKYLTIFSSGLAIINVIPCYGLDGQFLINTLINNLSPAISKSKKQLLSVGINVTGTLMLFVSIAKVLWSTFIVNILN